MNAPLLDGDRLYVFPYDCRNGDFWYPRFPCICLRADDGRVVWREERAFHCSEGSTPLISGDVLYIGGCLRDNILAAVDKRTGKLLWKVGEERDAGSDKIFVCGSSLTYQVVDGIPQIVVAVFQNDLMGVHARTGRVLWHWKFSRATASGMIPTPVALGSQLFLSAFQGGVGYSQCLDMLASDGRITPRLRYEDKRLQCNMLHTPSIYQGAVFGFGKGPKHEALQCHQFQRWPPALAEGRGRLGLRPAVDHRRRPDFCHHEARRIGAVGGQPQRLRGTRPRESPRRFGPAAATDDRRRPALFAWRGHAGLLSYCRPAAVKMEELATVAEGPNPNLSF